MLAGVLFWTSVAGVFYPYLIFPLILIIFSRLINASIDKRAITPAVSMIIAAYNEEESLAGKLDNALALEYPPGSLEIIVASDGSSDKTVEIAAHYASAGVKCLDLPRRGKVFALIDAVEAASAGVKCLDLPRRGKVFALIDAVEACSGEILVFSDANTLFEPRALQMMVRNFADVEVGGVGGNQLHTKVSAGDTSTQGERMYWSYDKWLKILESRTGSIVSADGAIYAIRKNLFQAPGSAAVTDDFAISTRVVEQGYRLVYEPGARASEPPAGQAGKEFGRKVRIINRGLRSVMLRKKLLNPFRYGFYSLTLFSHKISRRLVPVFLVLLFLSSLLLSNEHVFYQVALLLQAGFYAWAAVSFLLKNRAIGQKKIFYLPFFFCRANLANLAALVALYNLTLGKRVALWSPQR
jgi:cellulose synthase/poly-beta-1,6-N-acetylglucosamine synthase-like glycosyltransferase